MVGDIEMGAIEEIHSFLMRFYANTGIRIDELVLREAPWRVVAGDVIRRAHFKIGRDETTPDYLQISIASPAGGFCRIILHPDDEKAIGERIAHACAEPQ